MAEHAIPVDLYNPGQVFACLGLLEAADVLLGDAEGGFDWSNAADIRFKLRAAGQDNPVEVVLEFLAETKVKRFGPVGYSDPPPKKANQDEEEDADENEKTGSETEASQPLIELTETSYAGKGDRMALPIRLGGGNRPVIELGHWADGSNRNSFKLYAGNRSADKIAHAMLKGVRDKPDKKQKANGESGELRSKGLAQLWGEARELLLLDPFNVLTPMGGSFNFDPRGAWTAIDAGYSLNDQGDQVSASPIVEFLAAWGLEHARPDEFDTRRVRYAAWGIPLPPMLARAALCCGLTTVPTKCFHFKLDMSGKNKVVTFAELETRP
jgi:CRISPR-associated protein Csx14